MVLPIGPLCRGRTLGPDPIHPDDYLSLVDLTGRVIKSGKRGAIPAHLAPILARFNHQDEVQTGCSTKRWVAMNFACHEFCHALP